MPEKKGYLWDPMYGILPDVDPLYYDDSLTEPAVVSAPLPAKFNGSREAARRYAEGYRWGQENVVAPRERTAPYVAAGLVGAIATPMLLDAGAMAIANPYVRTALDIVGNIDGTRNLLSDNGVRKTIRLVNAGDTLGAIGSGVGDALDMIGVADLARFPARLLSKTNRALHAFDAIPPLGYSDHASRARTWLKDIITDKPVNIDSPSWYDESFRDRAASYIPKGKGLKAVDDAGKLAGEARFDAWRLYNGLPQKYGTYIPNADGSYRYNLEKIQKLSPRMTPDTFTLTGYRHSGNTSDLFTSAGGNLEYDNLYNFGLDPKDSNRSYELREIIDRWDLHPFSDMDQRQLSGTINALWQQPIQKLRESITFPRRDNPVMRKIDSALNRLRFKDIDFTKSKTFNKLYDKIVSMEAGKIIGGTPFLMKTEIPHTVDLQNDRTLWGFVGDSVPKTVVDYREGIPLRDIVKKHGIQKTDMSHIGDLDYIDELMYKYGGLISRLQKHYGSNEKVLEAVRKFKKGGDKATLNHPKYNAAKEKPMYDYLRYRGLGAPQASGMLGNLAVESWLNADLQQQGGGPAYGLMQAEASRQTAMKNYDGAVYQFGSNLSPEEQQQLDYIIDKGVNVYTPGEWGRKNFNGARDARAAFINADDVRTASDIVTNNFLRPGKPHIDRRRAMSEYYYDKYNSEAPYGEGFLWGDAPGFDFSAGGKIHIKPENRGKFTALKKRTGHSASWFKAHGTPAQKKMAVFELNSRRWSHKHGDGGYILGGVYDLSEEQIRRLIQQGYEVERV